MVDSSTFFKTLVLLAFLSIISYSYYPFENNALRNTSNDFLLKSYYAHLDYNLCRNHSASLEKHNIGHKCPENKIVSIATLGNTGNLMWAYASVLSIARQTGLQPYIPSCIKVKLERLFENLSIPDLRDIFQCPVKTKTYVTSLEDWKVNPQSIILPRYITKREKILPWTQDIVQEFAFKTYLKNAAQKTLRRITKNLPIDNYTFVGVHVRRTDYKWYLKKRYGETLVGKQYFLKAMRYFTEKYSKALFIFLSDDPKWCLQQFGRLKNVYVMTDTQNKTNGAELDLALLAACNHTIMDYGTYGEWGAILAGGETIMYNMIRNRQKDTLMAKKKWQLMS